MWVCVRVGLYVAPIFLYLTAGTSVFFKCQKYSRVCTFVFYIWVLERVTVCMRVSAYLFVCYSYQTKEKASIVYLGVCEFFSCMHLCMSTTIHLFGAGIYDNGFFFQQLISK